MSSLEITTKQKSIRQKLPAMLRGRIPSLICFFTGPILMYILVEYLNSNRPFAYFTNLQIALNLFWYYLLFFLSYLAIGRMKLACGVAAGLIYAIGTINHYVYAFRGRTIFPGDLLSLRTAANVAGGYNFTPDSVQIYTFLGLLGYIALLIALPHIKKRWKPKLFITIAASTFSLLYIMVFFHTGFLENAGIEPSMWTTRGNGFVLNFCVSLKYSAGEKPADYSESMVKSIVSDVNDLTTDAEEPVNIIVIMGESFADIEIYGKLPIDQEVIPFYNSLSENCIKGFAYSSVFGGTTANSEYEFLTGNSMNFLPDDTVPYQLYVDENSSSLVGQMNSLGYRTIAMHPYLPSGWNRVPVYSSLGFDEVYFQDDFQNRKYMRNYITDQCDYENVVRVFEEKPEGEKLFIFNITMQNHSSYNVEYRGLPDTIRMYEPLLDTYPMVNQYLSLMKQSDLALEWLINYFSDVEEKTLILIFGDHQPQVEPEFFELMLGGSLETRSLSSMQLRQKVPYCIWANYDIGSSKGSDLSLNYLSALLMETAGLPMTGYQSFLLELSKKLPVINSLGFITNNHKDYETLEELPDNYKVLAERYQILQYNEIFDKEDKLVDFFMLTE